MPLLKLHPRGPGLLALLLLALRAVTLPLSATETNAPVALRVFSTEKEALLRAKDRAAKGDPKLKPALDALINKANAALKLPPPSVIAKALTPASGDKHDFMSFGPYWWPDP